MSSTHIVVQGDTLYRIADKFGFLNWRSIYDHVSNAGLRTLRPNPHVLHPGDVVQIPDVPKTITLEVPLDKRTSVVRVPIGQQLFRLLLVSDTRQPLGNLDYTLTFTGGARRGKTDAAGVLRDAIPVGVQDVKLVAGDLKQDLEIGKLNPLGADTIDGGVSGCKGRLRNIGYFVAKIDSVRGADFAETLRRFQAEHGLTVNGTLDDATRARLQAVHGS